MQMSIDGRTGGYTLNIVVVQAEMGTKVLTEAKSVGVAGGTIFLGKGTIRSRLLRLLGLDEAPKEIVLMVAPGNLDVDLHRRLVNKFGMDRPNHGVIVSLPVRAVAGGSQLGKAAAKLPLEGSKMQYQVIFTIVERGLAEDVVDVAEKAGSTGATIINARGSGIHEKSTFFGMSIEPEKEIVMIIIDKVRAADVAEAIKGKMEIEKPGKGILFVLEASLASGLYEAGI